MMYFWSIPLFSDTLTHVSFRGGTNFYRNSSGSFRIKDIPIVYIHGIPIVFPIVYQIRYVIFHLPYGYLT